LGSDNLLNKEGRPFRFTVLINQGNDARRKTAEIIRENLKKVGIEMEIKVLEWQAMLHQFIDKKRFEAVIMGWALSRDPDAYDIWHSTKTMEGEFNFISYKNDTVDRLLLEGRRTFDFNKRKETYNRIHRILSEEQPVTFPLSLMPCRCSTKGLGEWKRHPSAYGMILFIGMFPKTRLNGINVHLCDFRFLTLLLRCTP